MNNKIDEVKKDIAELEHLQSQAKRKKVQDILSIEIRKLVSELVKLEEQVKADEDKQSQAVPSKSQTTENKCYQIKLVNYAWDQSDKFLKLYITLPKVQNLNAENVSCNWTDKSVELNVKGLENKDYIFALKNLLEDIVPETSYWKVKNDMVVIFASKKKEGKWSHVTTIEKKASDSKKFLPNKDDEKFNPEDSLMTMMKRMYETGDDEMKRTIAKAWQEGQMKKNEF